VKQSPEEGQCAFVISEDNCGSVIERPELTVGSFFGGIVNLLENGFGAKP
jgi:hypothetical protein